MGSRHALSVHVQELQILSRRDDARFSSRAHQGVLRLAAEKRGRLGGVSPRSCHLRPQRWRQVGRSGSIAGRCPPGDCADRSHGRRSRLFDEHAQNRPLQVRRPFKGRTDRIRAVLSRGVVRVSLPCFLQVGSGSGRVSLQEIFVGHQAGDGVRAERGRHQSRLGSDGGPHSERNEHQRENAPALVPVDQLRHPGRRGSDRLVHVDILRSEWRHAHERSQARLDRHGRNEGEYRTAAGKHGPWHHQLSHRTPRTAFARGFVQVVSPTSGGRKHVRA